MVVFEILRSSKLLK